MKLFLLVLKNLFRNKVRSLLTALAVMVLTSMFCIIATYLNFLHSFMSEKSRDIKLLITERYRVPSRFNLADADQIVQSGTQLNNALRQIPGFHSEKYTYWQFTGFTLDPDMKDKDQMFIVIATIPEKIPFMTDDLENIDKKVLVQMQAPPKSRLSNSGILMGAERMRKLNKRIGDVFKAKSITHSEGSTRQPIELQFEIVGELPASTRWSQAAMMDSVYLNRVLQEKKSDFDGKVDLAWLMVDDQEAASRVSQAIEAHLRDLKCETLSTAVSRFLEPLKDFLWGLKFFVVPAIVVVMVLIVANAIAITVRERTQEIAVLKVLGFGRGRVLFLVMVEGLLMGALGGLLGGGLPQLGIYYAGGIPIQDQPHFFVSWHAWWWGPALGAVTACLAGLLPAWNACKVKVSEVFSKVA